MQFLLILEHHIDWSKYYPGNLIKEKCEHTGDWSRLNIRIYKTTLELKFNSKQKEYRQNTFTYISKICLLGKKSKIIIPILFDLLVEAHPHYLSVLIKGCITIEFSEKKGPHKILKDLRILLLYSYWWESM